VINIKAFIHDLIFKDGIWHSEERESLSYPNDGNDVCYDIEDQSFWFKNRNKIILEVINRYSIDGPIFDVGGGNGFVSSYLGKRGFQTVLVEPGIDGCLNGKERGLRDIINSNFDTIHFFPNSIPNIGMFDVLEHIENQAEILQTIQTNLIQDGRLFITVPAFKFLWSEEDLQAGHFRRYRIKELSKLIDKSGFDVVYSSYFFSFLVIPIFIFRTIPSIFGFYKISTQKSKRQHISDSKANRLLGMLMKLELNSIKRGKSIFFGSSLLLVAKKR
jgi:SAM-dependent methyltransferase